MLHPNEKPTALLATLVEAITTRNHTILDPFTGSGATGVAALQSGRNFIGIELDKHYASITEERCRRTKAGITKRLGKNTKKGSLWG